VDIAMTGPLSHLRVLDLSRVLAGPWATQILADLGADVIKIERPGTGDDTRQWGPPYLKDRDGDDTADAAYFLSTNRGKRSLTLDISRPEGQSVARALALESDVVIENYKVGGLARYGLDHAALCAANPRLVYCSITGFGQNGPYAGRAGYDYLIQAMSGLMSITGLPDGVPGGGPMRVGVAVTDIMTGMYATVAILSALAHRDRTGEGQYIDMALLDAATAMLANQATSFLSTGQSPGRTGAGHPSVVPYQPFETADGHVIVAVGNDGQYARYCEALCRPDLATDPRFATSAARVRNRDVLVPEIAAIMRTRRGNEWISVLETAGVPCGPINTIDQVFNDPQIRHRGLQVELPHAAAGSVPLVGSPLRLSRTPVEYRGGPPTLGQHTDEVLTEVLGMTEEDIGALRAAAIV
jgi:crotonobetainyl-CoA:carnitine CoA-transferase CaiB-like acyl-CoA transferase